jgi:acetyl-CoA synthetase
MGRSYPGHDVRLVHGEVNGVGRRRPGGLPRLLARLEAATAEKVRDGRLHTGDLAEVDDEGYFRFVGRTDD